MVKPNRIATKAMNDDIFERNNFIIIRKKLHATMLALMRTRKNVQDSSEVKKVVTNYLNKKQAIFNYDYCVIWLFWFCLSVRQESKCSKEFTLIIAENQLTDIKINDKWYSTVKTAIKANAIY